MKPMKTSWRVVLVRPRNPLNIGAAARAMANFGLRDLAVVAPYEPVWQETRSAIGAEDVVRAARAVDTVEEAINDSTMIVGTSSGSRRNLDRDFIPLTKFHTWLGTGKKGHNAVLLFGSEKTGLSNQDLSYCHAVLRIPTTGKCPSMNLGQAVAVCCYELARAGGISARPSAVTVHRSGPANFQSLERVLGRAVRVMEQTGSISPRTREAQLLKLRRLLLDLGLTNNDVRILGGILAQIEWKLGQVLQPS
jgi:TrmH family RNA methyltransferase